MSAIYGYLKNKNSKFKKKLSEKSVEGIEKKNFTKKLFYFQFVFKSNGISLIYQYNFKKSTNLNKYIRTTKISRKHVLSTQLLSLASTHVIKYAKLCLDETISLFANRISSIRPYNKLLTMKTTTEAGKNQNFSRKGPEEYVEAIEILSSSLKTLSMIQ